jgi:hypothetical protein
MLKCGCLKILISDFAFGFQQIIIKVWFGLNVQQHVRHHHVGESNAWQIGQFYTWF